MSSAARQTLARWTKIAERAHWTVTYTGAGHLRWQPPSGGPVFTASTPSDSRAGLRNVRAALRRAGLKID